MRRREFITLFGGAATGWPLAAGAQQLADAGGWIYPQQHGGWLRHLSGAFLQGLNEAGYVEGRNVRIDTAGGENQPPACCLAADLVDRRVRSSSPIGSMAAVMAATKTIPVVFSSGDDPVTGGLVSQSQPAGRQRYWRKLFRYPAQRKRLGLLHELVPKTAPLPCCSNRFLRRRRPNCGTCNPPRRRPGDKLITVAVNSATRLRCPPFRPLCNRARARCWWEPARFYSDIGSTSSRSPPGMRFQRCTCSAKRARPAA